MILSENNSDIEGFILVVDDVPQNLQVLCSILGEKKYKIAVARNGKQALEMLEKITPDLILLDVMMPELNGFEVCQQLRRSDRTRDIPVIFLTAKAEVEFVLKGFEIGGVDYVTKPFNGAELLARVETHLELKFTREELIRKNKELYKAKKKLEWAARKDPLTTLSNRREMLERIEREKVRFERSDKLFTLVMGDLDNFKYFNDHYGHDCGDFILVTVSNIMNTIVRKQDSVSRWGGEEFLLLLPETDLNGGYITAEKIRQAVCNKSIIYNDIPLSVTITFGVFTYNDHSCRDIKDCIKLVDMALYKGKQKGKNCVVTD